MPEPETQEPETQEPQPVTEFTDVVTVVSSVYHRAIGEEATSYPSRFVRKLETRGIQPYQRKCHAGSDWEPLDCGWLEVVGMLVIENTEGRFRQVRPTDEQRAEAEAKVLEISFLPGGSWDPRTGRTMHDPPLVPHWFVPPRESMRATPADAGALRVRSQDGSPLRFTLYLLPE